uniref:Uncharacterized protein n=1 Tax=Anguilla anguilla TaxID=7936 RepID=A0A0E9SNR1_ANGAN
MTGLFLSANRQLEATGKSLKGPLSNYGC